MWLRVYLLHIVLLALDFTKDGVGARELRNTASSSNGRSIVYPTVHHTRTKREINSTRDSNGAHYSEVQVSVSVEGEQWVLELRLNEDLVTEGHTLQYQQGGKTVQHKPTREELELCHYSGSVRGKPQMWAAVSTCRGVHGVIFDGAKIIHIEPVQVFEIPSAHYWHEIYNLNLLLIPNRYLGVLLGGVTADNTDETELGERQSGRYNRSSDNEQVREPNNATQLSRYVELVIIADHSEFEANENSIQAVHSHMMQVANVVNSIYTPLNVYVALVGVVVWNERDEILISETMDETLNNLASYRKKLVTEIPNDSSALVTHQSYRDGDLTGLASIDSMCSLHSCSISRSRHYGNYLPITMAHELGHSLGLYHDQQLANNCICQVMGCLMSDVTNISEDIGLWSNCSVKYLSIERYSCLHNIPKRLIKSPTCGNGFVEPGEQCDCGIAAGGGTNPCHACCHPDTCMLRGNATCGTGTCCDLTTCQLMSEGVVCRAAKRECDLPKYCSGNSEYCPADVMNSTSSCLVHNTTTGVVL